MVLSADKTLIGPLSSTLGLEDLWDILEVITVDSENQRRIDKAAEKQ
jgi:hypothetical protein